MTKTDLTIIQHLNHLAARLQVGLMKITALEEDIAGIKEAMSTSSGAGVASIREDLRKDVARERALMEASMEHRIDQHVGKLLADKDTSAALARLERRIDDASDRLTRVEAERADQASRAGGEA